MKTKRCIECGAEATQFFGFATPCRFNGGSHQKFEEVETTPKNEAAKLYSAYHGGGMWYDRQKFDEYATLEQKTLLRQAEQNS